MADGLGSWPHAPHRHHHWLRTDGLAFEVSASGGAAAGPASIALVVDHGRCESQTSVQSLFERLVLSAIWVVDIWQSPCLNHVHKCLTAFALPSLNVYILPVVARAQRIFLDMGFHWAPLASAAILPQSRVLVNPYGSRRRPHSHWQLADGMAVGEGPRRIPSSDRQLSKAIARDMNVIESENSTDSPSAPEVDVGADLYPLRLTKPTVYQPACFLKQVASVFNILFEKTPGTREFISNEISTTTSIDPIPLSTHLVQQERRLRDCTADFAKLMDFSSKLDHFGRRNQDGASVSLWLHQVQDGFVAFCLDERFKERYIFGPLINGKMERHCDPLGSPFSFFAATAILKNGKTESHRNRKNCSNRGPCVPPDNTSILARRPARTNCVPPTHSLTPLWIQRHSATVAARTAIRHV